jgi:hypothetical protein
MTNLADRSRLFRAVSAPAAGHAWHWWWASSSAAARDHRW